MKTIVKLIAGVAGTVAAYEISKGMYYKHLSSKANKTALKIDIYDNNHKPKVKDPNDPTTIEILKLIESGNIRYLKSVVHDGKVRPCILIQDRFTDLDISSWWIPFGINRKAIYKNLLGNFCDPRYFKMCGGAFSTGVNLLPGFGIFDETDTVVESDGFVKAAVIVVDTNLKDFGISDIQLESIIYHEYWHCACENGGIENQFKNDAFSKSSTVNDITVCPQEEIECDAFAKLNVGESPNVGKIIGSGYIEIGKLASIMIKLKLLTEGRK